MIINILENEKKYNLELFRTYDGTERFPKEVQHIHFYGDGQVIYSIDRKYLEYIQLEDDTVKTYYRNQIESITVYSDFKRAVKLNLNRCDNFYINYYSTSYNCGIDLYINTSECGVIPCGEYKYNDASDGCQWYVNVFKLSPVNATYEKLQLESYETEEEILKKYPEAVYSSCWGTVKKPCYKDFDYSKSRFEHNGLQKGFHVCYTTEETIDEFLVMTRVTRSEKTPERIERERLAELFNKTLNVCNISHYDIEKLLKVVDITKKNE